MQPQIRPDVHVFGHSHVEMDGTLGGPYELDESNKLIPSETAENTVRYVQRNLGGQQEMERLYCIFDDFELTGKYVPYDGGKIDELERPRVWYGQ